jgi:DNA-binding response OmpR family regulator
MPVALVVEDMPEISAFVVAIFIHFGIEAFAVASVADAIEILRSSNDISGLFINLAEQADELDLAQVVSKRWPTIRMILLSARADSLRVLPPAIFMMKPTSPAAIIAIIKRVALDCANNRPHRGVALAWANNKPHRRAALASAHNLPRRGASH